MNTGFFLGNPTGKKPSFILYYIKRDNDQLQWHIQSLKLNMHCDIDLLLFLIWPNPSQNKPLASSYFLAQFLLLNNRKLLFPWTISGEISLSATWKNIVHSLVYNNKYNYSFFLHSTRQFELHAWLGLFIVNWLAKWEINLLTTVTTTQLNSY